MRSRAALIGLVLIAPLALAACASAPASAPASASASAPAEPKYGSLPSFLPKDTTQSDSILTGSRDRPALTTEGDGVRVSLGTGTVLATVTGPAVPGQGLPYRAASTTCTWTVTLTDATAAVPISAKEFSSLDHLGAVYPMAFVAGQPKPPIVLRPGQSATFELRAVMVVGEGLMRWAPDGRHILASWDFEVETD
jgi:hypothetical protein